MSDVGASLRNPAMMEAGLVQARPLDGDVVELFDLA